ncbi:thiamine phosphate synthase [Brevibacterium casei]|uniref:Thiamine-phosphate synthase n=1 Tax=Brevibacterium casei S18 TaxID=1229781 RepID=K9ARN9_9MICO|nr:thiamine phosphate synthase [Brevibacterium casei]EKU48711.1 thiamine-phosphate pyrophosphorylase [Brevibacterium casei S18]QQT70635.1 thiamine phosphate synthase [Brevibacterium casei]
MSGDRLAGIDTRLYLVTDTAQCAGAGRTVAETVRAAVTGGAGVVQVRDKDIDDAEFLVLTREVITAVTEATAGTDRRVPVFLNDRVAVARRLLDEGSDVHIHVGQTDTPVAEVRDLLGDGPLVGLSAAEPEEFATAQETGGVDLVGIGPVFDTTTKTDAPAGIGPDRLGELTASAGIPAVAIGGIDAERAHELRGRGLVGICVVSAICRAEDPEQAAADLLDAFGDGTRKDGEQA